MLEMRQYLPQFHRDFLNQLCILPQISAILLSSENEEWIQGFNDVVDSFKSFRDQHIQLTTVYIIQQSLKEKETKTEEFVGTGGTDLVQFLKQTRQETLNAKILKTNKI